MVKKLRDSSWILCLVFLVSCSGMGRHVVRPSGDMAPDGTRQIVQVSSWGEGFRAVVTGWEKVGSRWKRVMGPWPAVVGRNGFAPFGEKVEGDGRTPTGLFRIGSSFGREVDLKTGLAYRQLTRDDFWIDDIGSARYNDWVQGVPHDASSYEHMLRSDGLYDAGAVIRYNMDPVVPGAGSAIFFHIWRPGGKKPTAGCVALDEGRLRKLLGWLDDAESPMAWLNPTLDRARKRY